MNKREFTELPQDYQNGCHFIEQQCNLLLNNTSIQPEAIYWDKLNLHSCHLHIRVAGKTYAIKFGKRALTHSSEPSMVQGILFRLKLVINKIKYTHHIR